MKNENNFNYFVYYPDCQYPNTPPFNPDERYAEYPFGIDNVESGFRNDIYRMIREIFVNSCMDIANYKSSMWNPLGEYIKPGNIVLIKPNLVMDDNLAEQDEIEKMECLITHPSVVRCLFDYVYIALKGTGKIIIADAPVQDCDFVKLLTRSGYGDLFSELQKKATSQLKIDIEDLRDTVLYNVDGKQRQIKKTNPNYRSKVIDLGNISKFTELDYSKRYRITNYCANDVITHHNGKKNEYCVSDAMLQADVIINVPKPKTHRIAGYTAALKNMIGINTRKEYLPHHRKGAKEKKGDEYIGTHKVLKWINSSGNDLKNWALSKNISFMIDICNYVCRDVGKKLDKLENKRKKFGMWYGNDTLWRTILDVNKIVYFANKQGKISSEEQRTILHFGDMVVCGEKEGPLQPSYKKVGGILFSDNPVSFDYCVVKIMGFDYKKLPTLSNALKYQELIKDNPNKIRLYSNEIKFNNLVDNIHNNFKFIPATGWYDYL